MKPTASYLICATPRSGSTLLCELLAATGVAGRPREVFQQLPGSGRIRHPRDYLGPLWSDALAAVVDEPPDGVVELTQVEELGCRDFAEYLERVVEAGTTPNGVFGGKVMWGYLEGLSWHLAAAGAAPGDDVVDRLRAAFPRLRLVRVSREDKLRQAVSLWRAIQTWTWRHGDERRAAVTPVYHREAIAHLVALLDAEDAAWEPFLRDCGLPHLTVVYEDLAARPDAVVRDVLRFLRVPAGDVEAGPAPMRRQADATSEEWVARFHAESSTSAPDRYTASVGSPSTSTSSTTSRPAAPGGSIG